MAPVFLDGGKPQAEGVPASLRPVEDSIRFSTGGSPGKASKSRDRRFRNLQARKCRFTHAIPQLSEFPMMR
jgi:hypothetical protein